MTRVVDTVVSDSTVDTLCLGFMGAVGDEIVEIGAFAAFGDVVEREEENGVGAWGVRVALVWTAYLLCTVIFSEQEFRDGYKGLVLGRVGHQCQGGWLCWISQKRRWHGRPTGAIVSWCW